MKARIFISFGILFLFVLTSGGCIGGQQKPQGFSGVTAYEGGLYLGSMDGKVIAVDPSTRSEVWSLTFTMPSKGMSCGSSSTSAYIYSTPLVINGMVCVGIYNGKVLMINPSARSQNLDFPQARSEEWIFPRTDDVIGPVVGSQVEVDNTIFVCSSDGRVYALDVTYGDEKWKSEPLGLKLWITPVVEEGKVYVSTFEGYIYTLSAEDGSLLPWEFKAEVGFVSSPMLYEDIILVGSFDRNLNAVRIGDDEPLWTIPGGDWFWSTPVVKDGVVYAGCLDGKLYAIDAKTGNSLWEFNTRENIEDDRIVSSPIFVGDLLVVACESGEMYVLNSTDGVLMDAISIGHPVLGSLCTKDGIVYVRAQDNSLYAVDVEKGKISWELALTVE